MKLRIIAIVATVALVTACNSGKKEGEKTKTAKAHYGGTLAYGLSDTPQSLTPASIIDIASAHVATQIFQGLVKFNPHNLEIMPCLAKSWEKDSSKTKYTFHLRTDVKFQDNPCFAQGKGRKVTASDVAYSFTRLCTDFPKNYVFNSTFKGLIVGADEYYKASNTSTPLKAVSGIKVLNDSTIQIDLTHPSSTFLPILATINCGIVPKEGIEQYGIKCDVGTGPFMMAQNADQQDNIYLVKNPNYFGTDSVGNKLPYLDSLKFVYVQSKETELKMFKAGKIEILPSLPSSEIKKIVENQITKFEDQPVKYVLSRMPQMATQYYAFNLNRKVFQNIKVRQAFNYAINKTRLVNDVINGEAYAPGLHGIVPPTFEKYDIKHIKGYQYNPAKAKKLLAEAGYPNGKGFPSITLELNQGNKNTRIALAIQEQLKEVLGINVKLEITTLAQSISDAQMGKADIFKTAWTADYPSPQNFLVLFYGKLVPKDTNKPSYINIERYVNAKFDTLYEQGVKSDDIPQRNKYFFAAGQQMMNDAPIILLWYGENYTLINSKVKNYFANSLDYIDFSQVYLGKPEMKAKKKGNKS